MLTKYHEISSTKLPCAQQLRKYSCSNKSICCEVRCFLRCRRVLVVRVFCRCWAKLFDVDDNGSVESDDCSESDCIWRVGLGLLEFVRKVKGVTGAVCDRGRVLVDLAGSV